MKHRTWIVVALVACALWAAAPDVRAQADDAAAPPAAAKKMTLWDLIVVGGWAMWPLGACSFALVAMVVLNYRQLAAARMMPPAALAQIRAAAREQDLQKTWDAAGATKSLFTNALAVGLRHLDLANADGTKPKVESAIAEAVGREESTASYWINFLSLITAISPMLGLLGTVSGMIGAFQKIAGGGMGKPELLAGNIGEALITTAAGLIIAIPSMFFYFLFRNKLNQIIQRAEEQYSAILDDLTGTGLAVEEEPPAVPAAPAAPKA